MEQGRESRLVREGKRTIVIRGDSPDQSGAAHEYTIWHVQVDVPFELLEHVSFQKGPIKENGVNGVTNEDLLAIVIDRLEGFQSGPFACEMNASALDYCRRALEDLETRTSEREHRGVEGTNQL